LKALAVWNVDRSIGNTFQSLIVGGKDLEYATYTAALWLYNTRGMACVIRL